MQRETSSYDQPKPTKGIEPADLDQVFKTACVLRCAARTSDKKKVCCGSAKIDPSKEQALPHFGEAWPLVANTRHTLYKWSLFSVEEAQRSTIVTIDLELRAFRDGPAFAFASSAPVSRSTSELHPEKAFDSGRQQLS